MKSCPSCDFRNLDSRSRCLKCNAILDHEPKAVKKIKRRHDRWLVSTQAGFSTFAHRLAKALSSPLPTNLPHRYPAVAGALAFLPGAGQLYNRQHKKALLWILGHVVIAAIAVKTLYMSFSNVILAAWVLYTLSCCADAVATAVRINGQHWTARKTLALMSYLLFLVGIIAISLQYFFAPVFKLVYVSQNVFAPALVKGDRVLVDCVSYWFRAPRRGEVIYYDPDHYTVQIPGHLTLYGVNERRSFERISGIAGDRVEHKDGTLYFNGLAMPRAYYPLKMSELPGFFSFTVPDNRYLAIISHHTEEAGLLGGASPPLNSGVILQGWDKASIIKKKQIIGRVVLIYNPPQHRRLLLPHD